MGRNGIYFTWVAASYRGETKGLWINTLRPRQNGRHFPDDIFKCIFLNESIWIAIGISLKFVPKGPVNNIPPLVQIMAWRRPGDKPLSEPMLVCFLTHICVTRPQWVMLSPWERSLVKFHLSEFRFWKGFSPWGNRGSVAYHLLQMKTSATYPQPQVASQHLDGTWTRRPSPLPTAMLVWYGEQPRGITPLAESRGRTQDFSRGKPVTYHQATGAAYKMRVLKYYVLCRK